MSKKQLLIVYAGYSATGSTATLAQWIAGSVGPVAPCKNNEQVMTCPNGKQICAQPGSDITKNPECVNLSTGSNTLGGAVGAMKYVNVIIKRAEDATAEDVDNADGLVLGSGTYNGNPEEKMIEFVDEKLGAGKAKNVLANKIFGVFCTSAGYATGAQPVLNGLARLAMTFGGIFVGGGVWHTGQGVCGMVKDNPDGTWAWDDSMKYLQEDAQAYGERLGMITSFFTDSFVKAQGSIPSAGNVIECGTCDNTDKCKKIKAIWFILPAVFLAFIIFVFAVVMKKQ